MKLASLTAETLEDLRPYIDTIVLPVGTIHAHGGHLPLGADVLVPSYLAEALHDTLSGRLLLLPVLPYAPCEEKDRTDSVGVPEDLFCDFVVQLLSPWIGWGIRFVVLLNGHRGAIRALETAARRLEEKGLRVLVRHWWVDVAGEVAGQPDREWERAGPEETAVIRAIDERVVDMSRAGAELAKSSTPQAGSRILRMVTERLRRDVVNMWAVK
jgi:creatinine amidohydrolase